MKVILNSMKASQAGVGWGSAERERESSVVDVGEKEEDYRPGFVIILSLLIVNYLILASYNPLVCPLLCDRQGDRGGAG